MPASGIRFDEKLIFEKMREIIRQEIARALDCSFEIYTNSLSDGEQTDYTDNEAVLASPAQVSPEQIPPLRDQEKLEEVNAFLSELSPGMEELMMRWFDLNSLPSFLVQCGQFSRISQCWTACFQAIENGRQLDDANATLKYLLGLHNRGANTLQAGLVEPEANTLYDFEISQRFDSDGSRVKELVLPGLRNAGGKLVVKALVRLH